MQAAVFHGAHQPLSLEEVPRPVPGEGEVLVRVAACGVCHTDLHYVDHGVKTFMAPVGSAVTDSMEMPSAASPVMAKPSTM